MGQFVASVDDVARLATDAKSIAIGGFILYKKPMAVVRALIRQGIRDKHLIIPSASIDADLLLGAGAASKFTFAFCNLDIIGGAPNFRRAAESGSVVIDEQGTLALMRGLEAGERDLPFMPARTLFGSDLLGHFEGRVEAWGDSAVMLAPAVRPDVTFIHAQYADPNGHVRLDSEGFDFNLVKASGRVGVTVERLLPEREFDQQRGQVIEADDIDVIAIAPYGAHPTSAFPFYVHDLEHLLDYAEAIMDRGAADYVERFAIDESEGAYLDRVGASKLVDLTRDMAVGRSYVP